MQSNREGMEEDVSNLTSHTTGVHRCGGSESVAEVIREARQRKRLTQKELASSIGMSPVQLCRIENGEHTPTRQTLQKLSGQIGVPFSELLFLAGYNNMKGADTLYKRDGTVLDTDQIIRSIYRTDADFLELLRNFDEIGTQENLQVICVLLKAMRKEAQIQNHDGVAPNPLVNCFLDAFLALKRFILSALTPFLESYAQA